MAPAYKHPTGEEKAPYVQELFNEIAENYDSVNQLMSAGQWERWHRTFVQMCNFQPGMHILDVACGTGDLSMLSAAQVQPTGKVTGIDFSEGMLRVGRDRIKQSPHHELIDLQWGNAMDLQFEANTFDGATMGWAMRNVPSIDQTLSEIYRVLKPGASFVCLEAAKPYSKLVRLGFFLYFKSLLPAIDWFVMRGRKEKKVRPYTYLSRSLDNYPMPHELEQKFRDAGFRNVGWKPMMMGTVAIHYGTK